MTDRENITVLQQPFAPESRFFDSQGLRLHYLDWGNADAPTLLLIHGGVDHAHSWDDVALALRSEWHIVAPDLRGHGDSDWAQDSCYRTLDYVSDLAALIRHGGWERVAIIAHSMGGKIALHYAALFPDCVTRIVAVEGVDLLPPEFVPAAQLPVDHQWRNWVVQKVLTPERRPRSYPDLEAAVLRMKEANPHLSDRQAHHLTLYGTRSDGKGGHVWKFDNWVRFPDTLDLRDGELRYLLGLITAPVLLVNGSDSWVPDPRETGRVTHFRNAEVAMFEDAGHWVHHDRFDDFVRCVRCFLNPD